MQILRWIKRYKWWLIIGGIILVIIGLILGGIHLEKQRQAEFKQEMIKQVKEHGQVCIDQIKSSDPYNRIKKVTIDYDSVKHDPMGGIDFDGYVNDNKHFGFQSNLDKMDFGGKEKYESSCGIDTDLYDFLQKEDGK